MAAIEFRPMVQGDRAYFASSWLRSYRRADAVKGVGKQTFFYFHHRVLERLLARSRVVIACDRQDPDRIAGFVCFEQRGPTFILHYLFVRKDWREAGVGSALLSEAFRACDPAPGALVWTHRTRGIDRWLDHWARRRELAPLFNPYLLHEAP